MYSEEEVLALARRAYRGGQATFDGFNPEETRKRLKIVETMFAVFLFSAVLAAAQEKKENESTMVSVVGCLRDAGCVHRSPQVVKPLPNGCQEACVRAGSRLVVLTTSEQVYHPISSKMPDVDAELLPYAGKLVKITGHIFDRGGSKAIAVEHIEAVKD